MPGGIDRDRERPPRLRPHGRLAARLLEDELADGEDHAGRFEYRDEVAGHNHAPRWVAPTQQCFYSGHRLVFEAENGLVHQEELVVADGFAELRLKAHAGDYRCLHLWMEGNEIAMGAGLGFGQGDVRVSEK